MKRNNQNRYVDMILLVAGILCLVIFLITGFLLLNYLFESKQQEKLNRQLAELKYGTTSDALYVIAEPVESIAGQETSNTKENGQSSGGQQPGEQEIVRTDEVQKSEQTAYTGLAEINSDYVMWLQIADTVIDYPVVQRDNSYYLNHDFYGDKSKHGTIFLDEKCDVKGQFLLIHGHHMKDGTMFGSLKKYKKSDYRENHKKLCLDWGTGQEEYEIFAGALIDLWQAERFQYEDLPVGKEEIRTYLRQLKTVAFWYEEPQWEGEERFVVLSTCDYGAAEQRMILLAVQK